MDLQLAGRTALVAGGSRGIGAGVVRALVSEGMSVAICARESLELRQLIDETRNLSEGRVIGFPVDARKTEEVVSAVNSAFLAFGSIDVLVNCIGGISAIGGLEELSDDEWFESFDLNVMSVVRFARTALPHVLSSELKKVINISSISGVQPGSYNPHYTVMKAATINFTKYLANRYSPFGLSANAICAGPIQTSSWDTNAELIARKQNISFADALSDLQVNEAGKVPIGRIGIPEDIAWAVALLASPLTSWTTGSVFHISGGKYAAAF